MSEAQIPRVADLRVSYDLGVLRDGDLADTPLGQFRAWLADAADLPEPNAMVLATASPEGVPSARTVLLKEADARGFAFYTNLESRKGTELAANPVASLVFPWFAQHRQIVVCGSVELLGADEVDAYFQSRPRGSRLGAWASSQSRVAGDRAVIDDSYARVVERFGADESNGPVPVPPWWGGWLLRPVTVEFWHGRESRLHDRLRFVAEQAHAALDDPTAWRIERLYP